VASHGNGGSRSSADVVVVGFGAAGIAAAITAHDEGAEVVVLEKMPREQAGGNTRVSGQVWFSPHDASLAKEYLRGLSCDMPVDEDIANAWATEICANTDWLAARAQEATGSIDVDPLDTFGQGTDYTQITYHDEMKRQTGWDATRDEFPEFNNEGGTDYIYFGPSQGYSRLWLRIKAALEKRGVPIRYETRATALTKDSAGRVIGVVVEGPGGTEEIVARRGVVLASGGFENNGDMIRTYLGLPYATPWGTPANTGDGIRLAQALGADLANMYQYMPFFGIKIPGRVTGEFAQPAGIGFMNVRKDGRRFMDETLPYRHGKSTIGGKLEFYPHHAMWTVLDEDVRLAGPMTMTRDQFAGGWLKQVDRYDWSDDNSVEIENGWIARADSLRELADKLGVDPDGLQDEVARFNAFAENGEDPLFGRAGAAMAPIKRPPFYGYQWGNLIINTMGGLRKDGQARVRHVDGRPIPGLYCAGEIASTYTWALSGGQSIGDALSFGRIAGRNAAVAQEAGELAAASATA
jgi:succinate dehydrogenase/fumarate reductase flavoprotein subunit